MSPDALDKEYTRRGASFLTGLHPIGPANPSTARKNKRLMMDSGLVEKDRSPSE
jgi:hypothetical protein